MPITSRDRESAVGAFQKVLARIGVHTDANPDMARTPERFVKAMEELLGSVPLGDDLPFEFTTFASNVDQLIVVRDIAYTSVCAHHLFPFFGQIHVGYLPKGKIAGLSKIPRLVKWAAAYPQTQEEMTQKIANRLQELLTPRAVIVVATGVHCCVRIRGVKCESASMVTSAIAGKDAQAVKGEFFTMLGINR